MKPETVDSPRPKLEMSRRQFLVSSAAGGGLLFGFTVLSTLSRAEAATGGIYMPLVSSSTNKVSTPNPTSTSTPTGTPAPTQTPTPNGTPSPTPSATPIAGGGISVTSWIRIGTDESITVLVGSTEMGQGVLTGLPQILAEELMVDWTQIKSEHSPAGSNYGNPLFGGFQITAGSSAIRGYYNALRTAGASIREMMIAAAAQQFGVSPSECVAASGKVNVRGTNQVMTYGQLATYAAQQTPPSNPPLTPSSAFRLIGKPLPRLDLPRKVNGSAIYGIDVRLPGMVYAAIRHCPSMGGTLAATPNKPSGAIAVVALDNAVAVVADNTWKANRLARSLNVQWTIPATAADADSAKLAAQAQQLMTNGTAVNGEDPIGDVTTALPAAAKSIDVSYNFPYLAHACMEVLSCTAEVTAEKCEIWGSTQGQALVMATAMALTGLKPEQIQIHTTFLGGGLGRKIEQDYIAQVIRVAKAVGKPVKLTWSREEDFGHDQYRPMALVRVRAGLDASNNISAFWYRNVSPSITGQRNAQFSGSDGQATEGSTNLPYDMGNRLIEWVRGSDAVPVGYWRSVGHSINAFAVESAIDELALSAGIDPLTFRRRLLANQPRYLNVLNEAAALGQWDSALPAGHARGIALAESFGSIVAEVVEISQPVAGSIRVHSVAVAIDCGSAINPNQVEAQMQGGVVHGLTAALWGKITFSNGVATNQNFNHYRMLRMNEMPAISVKIIQSGEALGGAGEPGVPPIAPALANAYVRLTGTRIRSLPFFPNAATMGDG